MYHCNSCNATFENYSVNFQSLGECHGYPYQEPHYSCPICKDDDFDEFGYCECCGKEFFIDDIQDGFCSDCIEKISEQFETRISKIAQEFNHKERSILKKVLYEDVQVTKSGLTLEDLILEAIL